MNTRSAAGCLPRLAQAQPLAATARATPAPQCTPEMHDKIDRQLRDSSMNLDSAKMAAVTMTVMTGTVASGLWQVHPLLAIVGAGVGIAGTIAVTRFCLKDADRAMHEALELNNQYQCFTQQEMRDIYEA